MFTVTVLGSGSSGNCALIETPKCRLLVDAGLSARQIALRLAQCGVTPQQIDGILLTHEHQDHACGIDVWFKQYSTPIYCNRLTAEVLRSAEQKVKKDWRIIATGSEFSIADLTIQAFPVPHDAVEPVGFVIHHGMHSLGYLTDLGVATRLVQERVRKVHTLVVETNHDEKLLQNDTRRPWSVKQRISSRHGHLSNTAAAEVVAELMENGLRRAILCHLSSDCNTPELAVGTVRARIDSLAGGSTVEVVCSTRKEVTPKMVIGDSVEAATPSTELPVEPQPVPEEAHFVPSDEGECAGERVEESPVAPPPPSFKPQPELGELFSFKW
jgi:phosphoribosyl 1,2-cyclic phosphodiesterase